MAELALIHRRRLWVHACALVFGFVFLPSSPVTAAGDECQSLAAPTISMGQPRRVRATWAPLLGYDFQRDEQTGRLVVDVIRDARIPQIGLGSLTIEGAAGWSGGSFDYGAGLLLKVPWISAGFEYNFLDSDYAFALSANVALDRGGLFKLGEQLRIDYRPAMEEIYVGITFPSPLHKYRMTRPRRTFVRLPEGDRPEPAPGLERISVPHGLEQSIGEIEHAVLWMDRLLTPHFKSGEDFAESAHEYEAHIRQPGHTFAEEDERYHRELRHAFALALDGGEVAGDEMAAAAEAIILDRIVIPFNQLFGQNKSPHDALGFIRDAMADFTDYLGRHTRFTTLDPVDAERQRALAREVFRRATLAIDDVTRAGRKRWKQTIVFWHHQSRLVWLPLNYGLRPEQYDSQAEFDGLAERLTGMRYTDANRIEYLVNEQFHVQLKRMIRETASYHILWIHDFRGRFGRNETDRIGWDVVTDAYIPAFIRAIDELDRGERDQLPRFLIFLDENYYQANHSRQIMTFLERLGHPQSVGLENKEVEREVAEAHQALLDRIESSPLLGGAGRDCIEDAVKVNVSITNPYDPAFGADVTVRDHRKIAFRDVFEDDPASGEAVFTGEGVGEHYNGPSWEDRSILLRGTALVDLKTAARELLLSQGYAERETPEYLMPRPLAGDHAARCDQLRSAGWNTPVLLTMNETGYGTKTSTILKALTYNVASAGSVVLSYDSLWISEYWTGMLVSAALRGARVCIIAPSPVNAPSSAMPTMHLLRQNLDRLMRARERFHDELEGGGGLVRTGIYQNEIPVHDIAARVTSFLDGYNRNGFLRDLFPLDPSVLARLSELPEEIERRGDTDSHPVVEELDDPEAWPFAIQSDHKPFIHMKTQFFGSANALRVTELKEWAPVVAEYVRVRQSQVRGEYTPGLTPELLAVGPDDGDEWTLRDACEAIIDGPPAENRERTILSWIIGSQNQDRRGMMIDGEVMVAVSGIDGLMSLIDFLFVAGGATWPSDRQEFEAVFPPVKGPGLLKKAFTLIKDEI